MAFDHTRSIRLDVRGDAVGTLCRAMVEAGERGSLCVVDTATGKTVFHVSDIERRALVTVREDDRRGPRYVRWRRFPALR